MKIFESFRSAADKYGEELAREMLNAGIPAKYILAACRFHHEANGKSSDILAVQFRQWMTFVVPTNKTIDVNKLSYAEFTRTIDNVGNDILVYTKRKKRILFGCVFFLRSLL